MKGERPVFQRESQGRNNGVCRPGCEGNRSHERQRVAGGQTPQPLIVVGDVDQLGELLPRRRPVLAADPLPAAAAEGRRTKDYRNDVPTHETAHSVTTFDPAGLQAGEG